MSRMWKKDIFIQQKCGIQQDKERNTCILAYGMYRESVALMGRGKNWTAAEEQYLEETWGNVSIDVISRKLGRSRDAVINKKVRLGLGAFLENGDYITYCQLLKALYGMDQAPNAYRINKRWKDLPVRFKKVGSSKFKIIYLKDFWEWAEEHKHLLDFSKMEKNVLGSEPEWVKQKRAQDAKQARSYITDPWTDADDRKLDRLVREGTYTVDQLADIFHRTEQAVSRRIYDLCIDVRPQKNKKKQWDEEETQKLIFLRQEGYSFEQIGKEVGRSASSCRGKMERLENPEMCFRRNRRKTR